MASFLFNAHLGVRYIVLTLAVVALVAALIAMSKSNALPAARTAFRVYTIAIDLQVLLGLILVFTRPFFPALSGHIVMMLAVAVWLHIVNARMRKRPDDTRPLTLAITVAGSLVLIIGGILSIGRAVV